MTKKSVTITSISATFTQNGPMLFGLGSDGKVYYWTADNGGQWLPNWNAPAPAVVAPAAPAAPKRKTAVKKR